MKSNRKLSLNVEHLADLAPEELTGVVAADSLTQPLDPCVSIRHCQFTENLVRCVTITCLEPTRDAS